MKKKIKIGTRASQLALWQAQQVATALEEKGVETEIISVRSEGDINLETPLYKMNVEGVFTRYLDAAVLSGKVDIGVHSMKDVPTTLAEGVASAAVLKRGQVRDLLVYKEGKGFLEDPDTECVIATGSIRRKAQWLHHYPKSRITGLRGNVNTRLRKLQENNWDGALFAAAGLDRINLRPEKAVELDWMLPSPAQGAILVVCKEGNDKVLQVCSSLNDRDTAFCVKIERDFLRTLLGGCSTPISALAQIKEEQVFFEGNVLLPDGKKKVAITKEIPVQEASDLGKIAAEEIWSSGGKEIVEQFKKQERKKV